MIQDFINKKANIFKEEKNIKDIFFLEKERQKKFLNAKKINLF